MMIPRTIAQELTPMLSWFPVVSVTGPRQSGKSTLIKNMLPDYEYVNLEDETTRMRRRFSRNPTSPWTNSCSAAAILTSMTCQRRTTSISTTMACSTIFSGFILRKSC
ncbi:AAA family ATPase [Bifidobacterium bifidum]|uniref:AAA family ATPase n=2 Tax=Bifidobacterium bifidum TaxID=1681 RepID=UPI002B4B9A29|nr:AAA family ATPase [Bifidobacterium bifidum]